jgi:hypothetical protein
MTTESKPNETLIEDCEPVDVRLFPNSKYWKPTTGKLIGFEYLRNVVKSGSSWHVGEWDTKRYIIKFEKLETRYGNHTANYKDNLVYVNAWNFEEIS